MAMRAPLAGAAPKNLMVPSKAYYQEAHALPGNLVRSYMEDDMSWILPPLKPNPRQSAVAAGAPPPAEPAPKYQVLLRCVRTGEEYVHPTPLDSLVNYHIHFLQCYLFDNIDISMEGNIFPPLRDAQIGTTANISCVLAESFQLKIGETYQVIVTIAPEVDTGEVLVYLKSPDMPLNLAQFQEACPTTHQKNMCYNNHAICGLFQADGLTLETIAPPAGAAGAVPGVDAIDLLMARLNYDASFTSNNAKENRVFAGTLKMWDIESTAATVSLPLVLRSLHYLQSVVQDVSQLSYHIVAPTKFSYVVHIPSLGGWEVTFAVSMRGALESLKDLYSGVSATTMLSTNLSLTPSLAMSLMYSAYSRRADPAASRKLDTAQKYTAFMQKKIRLVDSKNRSDLPPDGTDIAVCTADQFRAQFTSIGTKLLNDHLIKAVTNYQTQHLIHDIKPLLTSLIEFSKTHSCPSSLNSRPISTFSTYFVLETAIRVFNGCAMALWKQTEEDGSRNDMEHAQRFIDLLQEDNFKPYATLDHSMIPSLLTACMRRPPSSWYEVFVPHVRIIQARPDNPNTPSPVLAICNSFLYNKVEFKQLFPAYLFSQSMSSDEWRDFIETALLQEFVGNAFDAYDKLRKRNAYNGIPEEEASIMRATEYPYATAFLMLRGVRNPTEFRLRAS